MNMQGGFDNYNCTILSLRQAQPWVLDGKTYYAYGSNSPQDIRLTGI